jgi:hypothetical protein
VDAYVAVDKSFARLHRAGWSVGDVRLLAANEGDRMTKRKALSEEAWHRRPPPDT